MSDLDKQGLTDLYNQKVVSAEPVTRSGNWSGSQDKGFHVGEKVTTENGSSWLVHNTPGEKWA